MNDFHRKIKCAEVSHKSFGYGLIIDSDRDHITIEFDNGEIKNFWFPSCFSNGHLEFISYEIKSLFDELFGIQYDDIENKDKKILLEKIYNLRLNEELAINTIFQFYSNKEFYKVLIDTTVEILNKYNKDNIISEEQRKVVIFTLAWLSFDNYDGNFWEHVRKDFNVLYNQHRNQQTVEKNIREIISEQDKYYDSRHITNVLVHSGVPKHFLKKFFDFIFDIYKINFDSYFIDNQNSEELLLESLDGLTNILALEDLKDDDLKLNATQKTYVLIQSSKYALIYYKESLAFFMKQMLEIIHAWYYDVSIETELPKVLLEKFNEWKLDNIKSKVDRPINKEYVYKPEYSLNKDSKIIKIIFPNYSLKGVQKDDFDKITIDVIIDANIEKLDETEYKIYEKIGYNTIEIKPQRLKSISNSVVYQIKKNDEIIISTNDSLNRKFIIFDLNGKERVNFKDYNDLTYVAYSKNVSFEGPQVKFINNNAGYDLAVFIANPNIIYGCGIDTICFSSMLSAGIYGQKIPGVLAYSGEKIIPVFKQVSNFVFESETSQNSLILRINNMNYDLNIFKIRTTRRGIYWNYNVDLDIKMFKSNLNIISILNKNNFEKELTSEKFLIDKKLAFLFLETDDHLIKDIIIESSFKGVNHSVSKFDFYKNTYFSLSFRLGYDHLTYKIDPLIQRYKWNLNENWIKLDDIEVRDNGLLYLASIGNEISIFNKDMIRFPIKLTGTDNGEYTVIETSYLHQLKQGNAFVYLTITNNESEEKTIKAYLKQVVVNHRINQEDNENIKIELDIKNFISNSLRISIVGEGYTYLKEFLKTNEIILNKPNIYMNYAVEVSEKGNLFRGIEEKDIYKFKFRVNDATKLINRKYFLKDAFYFSFENNNLIYDSIDIKPLVISFKEKLKSTPNEYSSFNKNSEMLYKCNLFKFDKYGKLIPFKHLSEIFVEITSKKTASKLNLNAEDNEGDGILFSNRNPKFLVDSDTEDGRLSLDYFVLDTERDEYK